jgi:beta-N-acetylhexosaminidase
MTLEELIGRTLVFGIPDPEPREEDLRLFRETHAGGLVLYRRNFESPDQLRRLIGRLEGALGRRLLVATDHEGGRVIMLRDGVTIFPDNLAVGSAGEEAWAARQGAIESRELRRLGVDLNLAPVLDVLTDTYSPNIGIRSYGKDPTLVARLGAARIRAMQANGLSACAKHFPGKGHSPLDAHLRLPTITSTWEEMTRGHLPPFRAAIDAGVDAVMTSHPLYPNLDPTPKTPATFSRRIVTEYLRGELGYRGVIVSDDLEMGAVGEISPIGEAAVRAARAGHDLLLVCHRAESQRAVAAALAEAYRSGALPAAALEASVERIRTLEARRSERFESSPPQPEPEGVELAREISRRAVTILQEGVPDLHARAERSVGVVFPRLGSLARRISIETPLLDETAFLRSRFGRFRLTPEILLVDVEPDVKEISAAAALAGRSELTLLFLFDAHLYHSNRLLLNALLRSAHALAVVLLRDPYDAELLPPGVLALTAFGFRLCQLEAVLTRLFGESVTA